MAAQWIFLCNYSSLPPANRNFPYCLLLTVTIARTYGLEAWHYFYFKHGNFYDVLHHQPTTPTRHPSYYSNGIWWELMC